MKSLLAAAIFCFFLYRSLCGMFDVTQAASKAGVAAAENTVDQILQ